MKILHFAHSFIPIFGGTTTRLSNLLSDTRNEHYLYVPQVPNRYVVDNFGKLKNQDVYGNITVRRCKLVNNLKLKNSILDDVFYLKNATKRLINSVKEKDIQIVHGHSPLEFAISALKYVKNNNLPFVYEVHGLIADIPIHQKKQGKIKIRNKLKINIFLLNEKKIFERADVIITQTSIMKNRITHIHKIDSGKIKIIPNGVDTEKFDPIKWRDKGSDLRKRKNWIGKIIFMYCGFLDDINGLDFFLEAVQELPDQIKQEIKIVILGRGPLKEYVDNMSKKESNLIEYLGLVNYDEMPMYYSACDVFVIPRPSTLPAETLMPMKLLEAMAMGKIVLGSNVGGIKEVLKNNENGIVFQKGNKDEFLKKMVYIVENMKNISNIGKQARKDVIDTYSWQKSREMLQNVYKQVIM